MKNSLSSRIAKRKQKNLKRLAKDRRNRFVRGLDPQRVIGDINIKADWGYHPLLVSLANTKEIFSIVNRPDNVHSACDVAELSLDDALGVTWQLAGELENLTLGRWGSQE